MGGCIKVVHTAGTFNAVWQCNRNYRSMKFFGKIEVSRLKLRKNFNSVIINVTIKRIDFNWKVLDQSCKGFICINNIEVYDRYI